MNIGEITINGDLCDGTFVCHLCFAFFPQVGFSYDNTLYLCGLFWLGYYSFFGDIFYLLLWTQFKQLQELCCIIIMFELAGKLSFRKF
jgi:hypothetical protein